MAPPGIGVVKVPSDLHNIRPQILEDYVRARLGQFCGAFVHRIVQLSPSVTPDIVHRAVEDVVITLPPPEYSNLSLERRDLQLVFRHDCLALGCLDPQCALCQHNPNRRCTVNFDRKYLVNDVLKAKCTANIRVELIDRATGLLIEDDVPDMRLEICVLDGNLYDAKFLDAGLLVEGGSESEDDLVACALLLNKKKRGKALLPDLHITDSSEAILSGRKPPFRLLVTAVQPEGSVLNVRHAVSEGFVVATRRTRTAGKADIPSVDDHVSKLEHMGKETVKKLQDINSAAQQAGIEIDIPENCVQKVGEFKQLALRADQDGHLRQKLQHVLKLSKEKWEEARDHAMRAVVADNCMRAWYADRRNAEIGLLFICRLGGVDLDRPVGLLQNRVESGDTKIEATLMASQTPQQREVLRQLQPQAINGWWSPGHPGWAFFPTDSEHFIQTGSLSSIPALGPDNASTLPRPPSIGRNMTHPEVPFHLVQYSGGVGSAAGPALMPMHLPLQQQQQPPHPGMFRPHSAQGGGPSPHGLAIHPATIQLPLNGLPPPSRSPFEQVVLQAARPGEPQRGASSVSGGGAASQSGVLTSTSGQKRPSSSTASPTASQAPPTQRTFSQPGLDPNSQAGDLQLRSGSALSGPLPRDGSNSSGGGGMGPPPHPSNCTTAPNPFLSVQQQQQIDASRGNSRVAPIVHDLAESSGTLDLSDLPSVPIAAQLAFVAAQQALTAAAVAGAGNNGLAGVSGRGGGPLPPTPLPRSILPMPQQRTWLQMQLHQQQWGGPPPPVGLQQQLHAMANVQHGNLLAGQHPGDESQTPMHVPVYPMLSEDYEFTLPDNMETSNGSLVGLDSPQELLAQLAQRAGANGGVNGGTSGSAGVEDGGSGGPNFNHTHHGGGNSSANGGGGGSNGGGVATLINVGGGPAGAAGGQPQLNHTSSGLGSMQSIEQALPHLQYADQMAAQHAA